MLVFLRTFCHAALSGPKTHILLQAGYMDQAQKYTDKAIVQIDKLKNTASQDDRRKFPPPLLSSFHVLLMEHIIQCRLVTGNKAGAVQVSFGDYINPN